MKDALKDLCDALGAIFMVGGILVILGAMFGLVVRVFMFVVGL